ncbi:uncharacterized protein [Branchiostoma lanceolatum]|uniref:uncharacterized protein n=1 Tax=Branchiostoma lanceolatum TaxID=7740 RepID=UPI0034558DB0
MATAAIARLDKIWKASNISFAAKNKLYKALVVSVLLHCCEIWTLLAETERKTQAFEMKYMRRLLHITYHEHKTNEYVRQVVRNIVGPQEPLLATVKRRKLQWFGHVTRHDNLAKTILQGTLEGGRRRGRQRKSWQDNIAEWTSLSLSERLAAARNRRAWRQISIFTATLSPQRPGGQGTRQTGEGAKSARANFDIV